MSCATATIKYLVFIFNTLCALLGLGVIIVTALALKNSDGVGRSVCIFLIVLGSIIFVISFVGCCGAIRENTCLIWTYAVFLMILVIANAVLMFGFITRIDGDTNARRDIDAAWTKELNGTHAMSIYQTNLSCCGKAGPQDYVAARLPIPNSCYVDGKDGTPTNVIRTGCLEKLIELYEQAEQLVLIFSWATLAVECAALICAVVLGIHFRNEQRRAGF